ncbi:TPA: EexN family lipoprotein [Klebsiella pneumoniae]
MKRMPPLLLVAALTACDPSESPKQDFGVPTVEELAADPERLKELRRQCKTERTAMGDVLCNRVAEATNKRFLGDGKVPYTPSETPPKF